MSVTVVFLMYSLTTFRLTCFGFSAVRVGVAALKKYGSHTHRNRLWVLANAFASKHTVRSYIAFKGSLHSLFFLLVLI